MNMCYTIIMLYGWRRFILQEQETGNALRAFFHGGVIYVPQNYGIFNSVERKQTSETTYSTRSKTGRENVFYS